MGKSKTRTSRVSLTEKIIGREGNHTKMNRKKSIHISPEVDVEQMLESNVICTEDGSSRTCTGLRNGDSIQTKPNRSRNSARERKTLGASDADSTKPTTKTPPNLTRTLRVRIRRISHHQPANKNESTVPLVDVNMVEDQLKLNKSEEPVSEPPIPSDENVAEEIKPQPEPIEARVELLNKSNLEASPSQRSPKASTEDNLKSPQRSKHLLKQLESSLSPKYMNPNVTTKGQPTSRYGRIRKQKENSDYIPLDVAKFITKSPAKLKIVKKELSNELSHDQKQLPSEASSQPLTELNTSPEKVNPTSLERKTELSKVPLLSEPDPSSELSDIPSSIEVVHENIIPATDEDAMSEIIPIIDPNASLVGIDKIQIIDLDGSFWESVISPAPSTPVVDEADVPTSPEKAPEANIVPLPSPGASSEVIENSDFYPGQMLWGSFNYKTPHWPCMLSPDPEDSQIRKIIRTPMLHVKFFGDNGRRAWIPENQVLPYCTMEQYKEIVDSKFSHLRRKLASLIQRQVWLEAVRQADDTQSQPVEAREKRYDELLEEDRAKARIAKKYVRGRTKSVSLGYHSNSFDESYESGRKRQRSPTPESPAYEPLPTASKSTESLSKRIKIESNEQDLFRNTISRYFQSMAEGSEITDTASGTSSECDDITEMLESDKEIYNNFLNISRLYVFEGQTETEVDQKLQKYVQKICALRMHSIANGARLSSRLRSQALRKLGQELGIDKSKENGSPVEVKPKRKRVQKSLEEHFIFELEKNYLMKGVPRGSVCAVCAKPNELLKCSKCYNFYHSACLTDTAIKTETAEASKAFTCTDCILQKPATCFVCNDQDSSVAEELKYRCALNGCGKHYHLPCLRLFPQHKFTGMSKSSTLFCPNHTCHTCISDDPRSNATTTKGHLIRCIKCPSSYHTEAKCVPAGSQILSNGAMICPKHNLEQSSLNVNWCFLCCKGGSLICCETCPTAFHLACLKFTPPEGKYICEECESGRMPLYNEIVWAKFGAFRFWPAITVPPPKVPENIEQLPHEKWDICVRFFGSFDHVWLNRRRIYLYQEGDSDTVENKRTGIAKRYGEALQDAKKIHAILLARKAAEELSEVGEGSFKPPMYVKIKSNRYVAPLKAPYQGKEEMDNNVCECNATDDEPCGPESNCINRALLVECNPKECPAKDRCQNQCFEKKQYPQLVAKRISQKGWGLVAMEDIRQGQFVIEYVGEVINNEELARRLQHKVAQKDENYYFLTVDSELTIDAGPKGNLARFINHSCEPNCETMLWTVGGAQSVGLFAIKNIEKGEELTFNYNFESKGSNKKICHCNAGKCSGFIGQKYRPPVEDHSSSGGLNGRRKSVKKEKGPKRRRSSAAPSAKRRKSLAAAENVASKDTKTDSGKRKKDQVTIKAEPTESTADLVGSNTTVDKPDDANVAAADTPKIDEGPIASKPDSEFAE